MRDLFWITMGVSAMAFGWYLFELAGLAGVPIFLAGMAVIIYAFLTPEEEK